ncbi:MAG: polyribonucleotide nucleotidyltransferase [Candidatus Omnitrophica bacterium]|nr:polyribonucleotide nucleotidyltransferase [Candidatus Omnitrophota bacterium]
MGLNVSIPNLGKSSFQISTGDLAKQADGSVMVTYGETMVLTNVCFSKESANNGFLPLMVDYQERTYCMGRFPGGYIKREGRPKDKEILTSRLIDRPLRPLFDKGVTNEIQIIAMVLSSDGVNDSDILAINGASCALLISSAPFNKPVGAVRIGKIDGQYVLNPSFEEREKSDMDFVIVGTETKIVMLEGQFGEDSEDDVFGAVEFAHPFIRQIIELQNDLRAKCGKEKVSVELQKIDQTLLKAVKEKAYSKVEESYGISSKEETALRMKELTDDLISQFVTEGGTVTETDIKDCLHELQEECIRTNILKNEKRPDGRSVKEIRSLSCQVGLLPRTHGSAVFTRGQTQALAITTLGTAADEQSIETLTGDSAKHFMLHYNFPPFSVGEVKFMRGPSRRDIGHGALAEKSFLTLIPKREDFPYTMRVVSEILESNGSSSMATICATTLSLMDAGVPLKAPVAGIAMGLISDGDAAYKVLTDIAGAEDHFGEMDFKVAGTRKGVTAIQLDTKIDGLTYSIIKDTLSQAKEARYSILDTMQSSLSAPRVDVSPYAPKIETFPIDPDKIGTVIGPGGKMIRRITKEFNVEIEIDDPTATVAIIASNSADLKKAVDYVKGLVKEVAPGEVYTGTVVKLANFGAFVEILPGKSGLVHVSEVSEEFVKDITQVLKEGDTVNVRVINIDAQGRINLTMKQVSKA